MFNRTLLKCTLSLIAACALLLQAYQACDADAWPSRPIRLVVPFAPGGSGDVIARPVADHLGRVLGRQFIVDNRTGAGGTIGINIVATAAPDGYTLLLSSNSLATGAAVQKTPYDPVKDFDAIGRVAFAPLAIVMRANFPARNLQEFVAYAKNNPGKVNFGTAGIGSSQHLVTELFALTVGGVKMEGIHYKGTAPSLIDLIGGRIDLVITTMASIRGTGGAERLPRLAYAAEQRVATDPDVPTMREAGFDLVAGVWWGMFGPHGLPESIRSRLNAEINKAVRDPAFTKFLDAIAAAPLPSTPSELQQLLANDVKRWTATAARAGVRMQ